jgi:hypothetical protein
MEFFYSKAGNKKGAYKKIHLVFKPLLLLNTGHVVHWWLQTKVNLSVNVRKGTWTACPVY